MTGKPACLLPKFADRDENTFLLPGGSAAGKIPEKSDSAPVKCKAPGIRAEGLDHPGLFVVTHGIRVPAGRASCCASPGVEQPAMTISVSCARAKRTRVSGRIPASGKMKFPAPITFIPITPIPRSRAAGITGVKKPADDRLHRVDGQENRINIPVGDRMEQDGRIVVPGHADAPASPGFTGIR